MKQTHKKTVFFGLVFALVFLGFSPIRQGASLPTRSVDAMSGRQVILGGQVIGVKIEVDGIMVVGFSDVRTPSGQKACPARDCALREGDVIRKINDVPVQTVLQMSEVLQTAGEQQVAVEVLRKKETIQVFATPVLSAEDQTYRLGAWVRDGTEGIGTLTFIAPEDGSFGALGHAITDAEVGQPIRVGSGMVLTAQVLGITKGTRGAPGELQGTFSSGTPFGTIDKNNGNGIYGRVQAVPSGQPSVPVATRAEVQVGPAHMISNIDGGNVEAYDIEIQRVSITSNHNKSIMLKVTDSRLLDKTGGIVQGMSGSPILQNGKLVGAVTHVFVNDPTRGYGILIENMLEEAE